MFRLRRPPRSTHRLSSAASDVYQRQDLDLASQADRIVYVDQGGIAESGTHEELLKNDGPYAALWQIHRQAVGDLQAKAALADTGSDT